MRIHKFEDADRDGVFDPGERMLEGLQFDVLELLPGETEPRVHQRRTDAQGRIEIGFPGPTRIRVRELLRQAGGRWGITTAHQRGADGMWYILPSDRPASQLVGPSTADLGGDCDDVDLWVGNAPTILPKTGAGGASPRSHPVGFGFD